MLKVRIIGPMRLELDGATIDTPSGRREWSLLAWLALHPGRHPRGELAARFWPDVLDASARASLRSALWALRRGLTDAGAAHLHASRDMVGLEPADGLWVDVRAFEELVDGDSLDEALAIGDDELLPGFDEPWALDARAAHRDRLVDVLEQLVLRAERGGGASLAVTLTRRQVALDPLSEEAHRRLMQRLVAAGEATAALADYARLRERLRRELGVAPSLATRRLAEALRESAAAPGAGTRPATRSPGQPALVGRERELTDLLGAWAGARSGNGGAVVITGEAGIGKTRLAAELVHRATEDGAGTAACAGIDLAGAAPMGMWAELIGELSSDLEAPPIEAMWPANLAALAPELERRFDRDPVARAFVSPELERARLYEATVDLLQWAAGRRPLVLVMEDVHLADPASLQLAGYIARRLARLPVLMVLTRRALPRRVEVDALEQLLHARGVLRGHVSLGPLGSEALHRLVREVADLDEAGVAEAVRAAEGNALLALEWARALQRGEREPPASLRAAVRALLGPLDPQARLLAEFAATAGRELLRSELEALPIASPTEAATAVLESGLFLAERGRLGYRHALLRDAAYADVPDPRRAWLHETLAQALRTGEVPAQAAELARHLRLAGRNERAAAELVRAAAHARTIGAVDQAAAFLEEALELAGEDPLLLVELAEVEAWRSRADASDAAFERAALRLPASGNEAARAWLRRAEWNGGALCRPREIQRAARRAVEALDPHDIAGAAIRARALAIWGWGEAVAGDPDTAERLLAEVHAVTGREGGDLMLATAVGHARGLALVRQGRFTESYAPQIAGGEAAQRAGRPDLACGCWLNGACAAACAGEMERALEFVERGSQAIRGQRLDWFEVQMLAARAHVLLRLGRPAEARDAVEAQRAVADRVDEPKLIATAAHDQGMVALALGEHERAASLLELALECEAPVSRPLARLARAEALVAVGRCDEAEAELRATALEPVRPSDFPETLVPRLTRIQGLVAAARDDGELAARRLEEAAAGWRALLDRSADGERYAASFADFARPPVLGLVEPERELALVEAELSKIVTAAV